MSTAKALSCASQIGETDIAVFCEADDGLTDAAAALAGVTRVLRISRAENKAPLASVLAPQIAELAADYTHVLAPSSTFGKDILPRAAALLGVPQVSDIMSVISERQFQRPIYAGNVIIEVSVPESCKVIGTVRR